MWNLNFPTTFYICLRNVSKKSQPQNGIQAICLSYTVKHGFTYIDYLHLCMVISHSCLAQRMTKSSGMILFLKGNYNWRFRDRVLSTLFPKLIHLLILRMKIKLPFNILVWASNACTNHSKIKSTSNLHFGNRKM